MVALRVRWARGAVLLWALLLSASMAAAQTVSFSQLDFDLDGALTFDSAWGAADLTFTGSPSILYFNLGVDGSWQLQNLPVLSTRGAGTSQTQRFWFDLGAPGGTNITSLGYAFALTPFPLGVQPPGAVLASVGNDLVKIGNGTRDPNFHRAPAAAGPSLGGAVADPVQHKHENFPNQEAGWMECAPTAVSNSLQFLNAKHNLGIVTDDITIEKMKAATNWGSKTVASAPGEGVDRVITPYPADWDDPSENWMVWTDPDPNAAEGQKNAWWQDKQAYMESHALPITTRQILPADIAKLIDEMDFGQDIEAVLDGHVVSVTGIADLGNARYSVTVAHDSKQDETGGTVEETGIWDSNTSSWEGALRGRGLRYFIVECPTVDNDPAWALPGDGMGAGSHASFGQPDLPPIPAGFFDPGSAPFVGEVALRGPTPPGIAAELRRYAEPISPSAPPPAQGTIDVEIVSLNLVSVQPILVSVNGGSSYETWNLHVTLSDPPPFAAPPLGTLHATKTHANGGSFEVELSVQPLFTFTRATAPFDVRVLDTAGTLPPLHLGGAALPWVHQVNPALHVLAPSQGSFVPGVLEVIPGDASSQQIVNLPLQSDLGGSVEVLRVAIAAAVPSASGPGRFALALLLLLGGCVAIRRRV